VLGRRFPLIAGDGFTPFSATYRHTGGVARGMFISEAGLTNGALGATGKAWVAGFRAQLGREPDPYSAYSAQALDVILDGIAASDGTRAVTTARLLQTHVANGIIGPFSFDRNGDITRNAVTQYRLVPPGKGVVFRTIVPPARLVN